MNLPFCAEGVKADRRVKKFGGNPGPEGSHRL
jgi:hypothetical protein